MIECMRGRYHHIMSRVAGVVTCGAIAALAHGTSETMSIARGDGRPSPVPAAPLAVAIGAIARAVAFADATTFERTLRRGVTFCGGSGLKMGVAALGAKLSLTEIGDVATAAAPVIVGTVGAGLAATPAFNAAATRRLGNASGGLTAKTGALLAAGSSICGVTAIGALAPAIGASQREVSVAVANVVAYGTMGMMTYPYLAKWMFPDGGTPAGVFLGLAVHDTSQVVGAGMTFRDAFDDEDAFKAATVTTLTRNLLLAVAIPYLAMSFRDSVPNAVKGKRPPLVPGFLIAFLSAAALRSMGDATESVRDDERWKRGTKFMGDFASQIALPTAMAAVGLSTTASSLAGVGTAPFVVGACAALSVGCVAGAGVKALVAAGVFHQSEQ